MSIMEDFEGVKKIRNEKNFSIDFLYSTLREYEGEIGKVELREDGKISVNVEGKYLVYVYLVPDFIKIERALELNEEDNQNSEIKSIDLSIVDRAIEQIYDLFNTIDENGNVKETITGVKKVLFAKQENGRLRDKFCFTSDNGEKTYEITENKFSKEFVAVNCVSKLEEFSVRYANSSNGNYTIIKVPYLEIAISKEDDIKTLFEGVINTKALKVRSDYSGNHFLVEIDEIVVGAIDLLNETKDNYRLEINDYTYEYLIAALTIIIDLNHDIEAEI